MVYGQRQQWDGRPARWVSFGPVAVQISRTLLYATYFTAGMALGTCGRAGVGRLGQALARRWVGWTIFAGLTVFAFVSVQPLQAIPPGGLPRWAGVGIAGLTLIAYCAGAGFAVSAMFMRFGGRPGPLWTSLAANSFIIYLLHYPAVTWVQYALLPVAASALTKGTATFGIALVTSWGGAVLLRKLLGVARVM